VPLEEATPRARQLFLLKRSLGIDVFVVDYAPPNDLTAFSLVADSCSRYGFRSFTSTIELDRLP
jgi:hypothetical protein